MFTHAYKTGWIHGYCDKSECKAQANDLTILGTFKSYRAAQIAITKHEGKYNEYHIHSNK